jgi:hypothetical protein
MIRADVRSRLTRDDAQLALRLVARGSHDELESAEERLRSEGLDALLDDPRLPAAIAASTQAMHASLPLFAYVAVRHSLRSVGEDDVNLADYVASIILHFGIRERARRVSDSDDQTYDRLAEIAADLDDPDARRSFLVRAHLGNYALWMCGLFPDYIESRRWRRGGPDLGYFEEMGRRGYALAAGHRLAEEHGLASLYAIASERFERIRVALNSVSDAHFFPNVNSPDRLMRQVRDDARWRQQH